MPKEERRTEVMHARVTMDEKTSVNNYLKKKNLSLTDLILKSIDKPS